MVQYQLCILLNNFIKTVDLLESMTKLPLMSGVSRIFSYIQKQAQLCVECVKQQISLVTADH